MTITRYAMAEDIGGRNMHPSPTGEFVLHSAITAIERAAYERGVRDAASVVRANSEWVRSSDNSRNVQPRGDGDLMGTGYVDAILALLTQEGR